MGKEAKPNSYVPNWIGGAYTVSYQEILNGIIIIRNKTIFRKRRKTYKRK